MDLVACEAILVLMKVYFIAISMNNANNANGR